MNIGIARGRLQQIKGMVIAQWGQLTGNDLRRLSGRHQQKVGQLDAACGLAMDEIARQIDAVHRRGRALYTSGAA